MINKKVSYRVAQGSRYEYQIMWQGKVVAQVSKKNGEFVGKTFGFGSLDMNLRERTMKGVKAQMQLFVENTPLSKFQKLTPEELDYMRVQRDEEVDRRERSMQDKMMGGR